MTDPCVLLYKERKQSAQDCEMLKMAVNTKRDLWPVTNDSFLLLN